MKLVDLGELQGKRFKTNLALRLYLRYLGVRENIVYTDEGVYFDPSLTGKIDHRKPVAQRDGRYWILTGDEEAFDCADVGIKTGAVVKIQGAHWLPYTRTVDVFKEPCEHEDVRTLFPEVHPQDGMFAYTFFDSHMEMFGEATGSPVYMECSHYSTTPKALYGSLDVLHLDLEWLTGKKIVKSNLRSEDPNVLHFPGGASTSRGYEKTDSGIEVDLKWLLCVYEGRKAIYNGLVRELKNRFERLPPPPGETKTPRRSFFVDRRGVYVAEFRLEPQHTQLGDVPKISMEFKLFKNMPFGKLPEQSRVSMDERRSKLPIEEQKRLRRIEMEMEREGDCVELGTMYHNWSREQTALLIKQGASREIIEEAESANPAYVKNGIVVLWPNIPEHLFANPDFTESGLVMNFGVRKSKTQQITMEWTMSADYEQLCGRRLMGIVD